MIRLRTIDSPGLGVAAALAFALAACQEELPTGVSEDFASTPVTVELELPWSAFASNLEIFGGYGTPAELGVGVIAADFGGTLAARTLVRFGAYPRQATVRDSTGTQRTDSLLTYESGRVVAFFDTIASTNTGPVTVTLGALQQVWHARSANWAASVDTVNDSRPWPEAGGGPVTVLATETWDPATGDSLLFQLDSAELAAWADTTDLSRGARLELVTTGERLHLRDAALRLDARSSIADTVVKLSAPRRDVTFIYDPIPQPPPDGVRVGGAPAWRTVLDIALPAQIDGPAEFCAQVRCPHVIEAGEVSYAALVLTSRASEVAFQPSDSVSLDVRPVLQRAALPKAPLGSSLIGVFLGRRVGPEAFGAQPGERVEIPITNFVRDILSGGDGAAFPPSNTLALLSAVEPLSIAFASFDGPGSANEPSLRLILTIGAAMELP